MTKEQVFEVIKKNILANIEDITADEIKMSGSLKYYGANSLDMIEIVSTSMRELNIKVPRSELADLQNLEDLVNLFMKYLNNQ